VLAGSEETFSSIFLVMDYMPYDLRSLMNNDAMMFDKDHAIAVLYNILCGVNFLHTANVIHRDLKPANILIDRTCVIKICDFGISKTYEEES
jgi:mitogen-activated protein kinase 1/3